jgi:hypothetical protein
MQSRRSRCDLNVIRYLQYFGISLIPVLMGKVTHSALANCVKTRASKSTPYRINLNSSNHKIHKPPMLKEGKWQKQRSVWS